MLKIGEFAKLANVSVKTLHHYGQMGLLPPAWIDRYTGYRYYDLDQLPRLNRILALKDLGLSLEQITTLLEMDLPPAQLRGMLRMKQAELRQHIRDEQARLARVEARLEQIEMEGCLPAHEVILKQTEHGSFACIALPEEPTDVARVTLELYRWIERNGYFRCGPCTQCVTHDRDGETGHRRIVELRCPVERINPPGLPGQADLPGKEKVMQPKIVVKPAFTVVGMRYFGQNKQNEISALWNQFNLRFPELTPLEPTTPIGLCSPVDETSGDFEYITGFVVNETAPLPEKMVACTVPEQKYAVFTHRGPLSGLGKTYEAIYQSWLPQSGLKPAKARDFELYGERFKFDAEDSELELYVPVE